MIADMKYNASRTLDTIAHTNGIIAELSSPGYSSPHNSAPSQIAEVVAQHQRHVEKLTAILAIELDLSKKGVTIDQMEFLSWMHRFIRGEVSEFLITV